MPRRNSPSRNNLHSSRQFTPGFGARHPVVFSQGVQNFFGDLDRTWANVLPEREVTDEHGLSHWRRQFRVYDDREKIGMTVMERRISVVQAAQKRLKWTPNDIGRIKGNIENEIARLGIVAGDTIPLMLTGIVRVGDAGGRAGERKLAAIADQSSNGAELLVREHEIISNGLGVALKGFRYPYEEFIPKLTIGRIYKEAAPEKIDQAVELAQKLLPLIIEIEPLKFFAQQEI